MITFDEKNGIFYLENSRISYAFAVLECGLSEHLYFGRRVGRDLIRMDYPLRGRAHVIRVPEGNTLLNPSKLPQEFCLPLAGDFFEPSLEFSDAMGRRRRDFAFDGYEILPEKPKLPGMPSLRGGETLAVRFASEDLVLTLRYTIYEDADAVARSVVVENRGTAPVTLERVYSFAFSLPSDRYEAVYLHGASGAETHVARTPLDRGVFTVDSKCGLSSARLNPFLAVVHPQTGENAGEAWGVNLVYSGNFALKAEVQPTRILRVLGGLNEFDFRWQLGAGESFATPEAVLTYSAEGLSGLSRQFHDLYREKLLPERFAYKPRPVVINNWEGTRFLFTPEKLHAIIDHAAKAGVDMFVLDDGWFGKRDDDSSGLGDWFVNEKKMGGTLADLIRYTHDRGLRFGLWFEPEMVSEDSDLFRAHPDWAIRTPGVSTRRGRKQLVLDLTREEVRNHVAQTINRVLHENEIDYFKWDCNRDITDAFSAALPPERMGEFFHRYVLGLYDLFERIVNANPKVLFEGCASGGSRVDPGILAYFPQIWISDQSDAPARCRIQYGASLPYPLSSHSCHFTASPNRRAGHVTPPQSRADIAALGMMGFELDLSRPGAPSPEDMRRWIEAYRADEELVLRGDLYRLLSPYESNLFAEELVSKDRRRARVTVMLIMENFNEPYVRFFPMGLEEDAVYFVPELGRSALGRSWMYRGFELTFPQGDFNTLVFHFEKE